jgi:hypothetical protein
MAKTDLKTKISDQSVEKFLDTVADDNTRRDCYTILNIMKDITRAEPRMWGSSMVGFGSYHYKYESGREGDWFLTGFSPRKQNLTLYIMSGFNEYDELMQKLGTYKTGKSCLYVKRLDDIDPVILKKLIKKSIAHLKKKYR